MGENGEFVKVCKIINAYNGWLKVTGSRQWVVDF